jgi:hypothetical protein
MSKLKITTLIALSGFLLFPKLTFASTGSLYFDADNEKVYVGQTFDVTLYADSKGSYINTVEANLKYSTKTLELVSVKQGSVFFLGAPASGTYTPK